MTTREDVLRELNGAYFRHASNVRGQLNTDLFFKDGPSQVAEGIEALAAPQSTLNDLDAEQARIFKEYSDGR